MGDVLPFERPTPREGDEAMDDAPRAQGEVVDLSAKFEQQLRHLSEKLRMYTERAQRVDRIVQDLRAKLFGEGVITDDAERAASLDEFEGARAVLQEIIAGAREVSAQLAAKLTHLDRMQAHGRTSEESEAA